MAIFLVGPPELGAASQVSFGEFIDLVTGRAITTAGDWGAERVEFGMSGNAMLRILQTPDGLMCNVISTLNRDEIPTLVLSLPLPKGRIPARDLEARLRALRNLYALVQLAMTRRGKLLTPEILDTPDYDFERLLEADELLYIESLGSGSWVVTLWVKARSAYASVFRLVAAIYPRAREAILRRLEAEARLKELEAEEHEFKLLTSKADYALRLAKSFPKEQKQKLTERVLREIALLVGDAPSSPAVQEATRALLPPDDDIPAPSTRRRQRRKARRK